MLAHLIVRTLLPGGAVTVAVDDTLFKRRGKKVFGAAWQHDGAAVGVKPVGRGTCFVVVGIVAELPFLTRPVCLPVMARLWRPKTGASKIELAASMVRLLAVCLNRRLHVVADAPCRQSTRHRTHSRCPGPPLTWQRLFAVGLARAVRGADRDEHRFSDQLEARPQRVIRLTSQPALAVGQASSPGSTSRRLRTQPPRNVM